MRSPTARLRPLLTAIAALGALAWGGQAQKFFTTPLTPAQLAGKQAVLDTTAGRIVIDLLPEQAPNHSR